MAIKGFHNLVKISADADGNAPKTIELLRTGKWNTPWHGDFEITREDIQQFVLHASIGVGLVQADPKIPLNYGHASYDKAAGWIPSVYASDDGEALLGDPDWTPAAVQAIKDGEWKYISPEFNPSSYPWEDPEEEFHFVKNVITGAALTNIPLFKKLKPIQASRLPVQPVKADATGTSDNSKGDNMTLEEIRAKEVAELNDEEKAFLAEHKSELSAEDLEKYGLKGAEADKPADEDEEKPEPSKVEASAIKGLTDAEITQLRADAEAGREAKRELEENRARTFVQASIKAGRVKSDQQDAAVKLLLASKGEQRTRLEAFINGLPENKLITADELGSGKGGDEAPVELSDEEKSLASDFGNTPEDIAEFKKQESK
ncbi:phage protease [Arthrobacter sp. EpRS71]|uniref:phage protease n=1 Tax=Arthrobacter sp. EpRS71 TaxID=1743141 RepID=UPI0007468A4F|nr:phage protease [Arthrobacter sp. EpRS71]KUM39009.1 hypothetical protein AR689_07595 [Arthrobacter sp. EpRS71]